MILSQFSPMGTLKTSLTEAILGQQETLAVDKTMLDYS
jgi:hypothetical protein